MRPGLRETGRQMLAAPRETSSSWGGGTAVGLEPAWQGVERVLS